MKTHLARQLCVLLLIPLSVACEPFYGPDYQGKPLATFGGQVTSSLPLAEDIDVAISWIKVNGNLEGEFESSPIAERADITGSFPAEFKMEIYEPPPEEVAIEQLNGTSYGIVTAIVAGAGNNPRVDDLLGVNEEFFIVYFPSPLAIESLEGQADGAVVGYNLFRREGVELPGYEECASARGAQIEADCRACENEFCANISPCECEECEGEDCEGICEDCELCEACFTCDRAANISFACHIEFKRYFVEQDTGIDLVLDPERARNSPVWRDLFGGGIQDENENE